MKKFNGLVEGIENLGLPLGQDAEDVPDTDSDVGECGELGGAEEESEKVIIHVGAGVEIHVPMEVAKMIAGAVSGAEEEPECGCEESEDAE